MSIISFLKTPTSSTDIRENYLTIFGFDTTSKLAAQAIDIVYWFIIFVAYCFAFHALNNILITWNWFLVGLACFAVVGLPYCVKIILFGRKEFPLKATLLCVFLSLLPTIFDFTGLYAETGIQDSLKTSKVQISDTLAYFEAESKKAAQQQEQIILNEAREKKLAIENEQNNKVADIKKDVEDAQQQVIDEKEGVKSRPGEGPRAKELQSAARKLKAQSDIEVQASKSEIKRLSEAINQETDEKLKSLAKSTKLLDDRLLSCKKEINNTENFRALEAAVIDANSLVSSIASNLNIKFTPVKITGSDNIIKESFRSLIQCDITALVCFLLAFLMEIGDIIIAFTIRYEKKKQLPLLKKTEDDIYSNIRYTKTYDGY